MTRIFHGELRRRACQHGPDARRKRGGLGGFGANHRIADL